MQSPYRTPSPPPRDPADAASALEQDDLFCVLGPFWLMSLVRAALPAVRSVPFDAEATLAVFVVVGLPLLLLAETRARSRGKAEGA